MTMRPRPGFTSVLLAGTAMLTLATLPSAANAAPRDGAFAVAQAPAQDGKDKEKDQKGKPPGRPAAPAAQQPKPPERPAAQPAQRPAPPPAAQRPAPPPAAQQAPAQQAPAARPAPSADQQQRREQRRDERQQRREERANQRQQNQPAATQQQPASPPATPQRPAAAPSAPQQPASPPAAQQRTAPAPSTSQQTAPSAAPGAQQPAAQTAPLTPEQRRDQRRQERVQERDQERAQERANERANQRRPQQAPAAATQQPQIAPSTVQPSAPQAPGAAPAAAVAPPTQPRDAREFIRRDRDDQAPARRIDDVRRQRQESRDGNRVVIREGDRTIIRENNTTIIRHNESNRFTINATNVNTVQRGGNQETVVRRPGGYSIVTVTDANGRLLRRMRRDARGRDIVIIDNDFRGPRAANMFVMLPPPVIRIPRERYVVETWRAPRDEVYGVFLAPPVEPIAERYTLEQVRFSAPLRDRMPRVDLDVTFDTGSWQLSPEQIDKLGVVAEGINRALRRNPKEVVMVEGYTDAVGNEEDNLSLSDRRAEAVAVALTEQFGVPPENLVTQGYGEQYLKVDTQGPEEANRRVALRRVTPLIDQQARAPR